MTTPADDEPSWLVLDSRRLSLAEYRRQTDDGATFAIAVLLKLVRWRLPVTMALPRALVWLDQAGREPGWARDRFAAEEPGLLAAGLTPVATYGQPLLGTTTTLARVFVDPARLLVAQVMVARSPGPPTDERTDVACTSRTTDGRVIATGNARTHLDEPPTREPEVVVGRGADVVRRHRDRISDRAIVPVPVDGIRDRLADEHDQAIAFLERRRVLVPARARDLARLRALPRAQVVRGQAGDDDG